MSTIFTGYEGDVAIMASDSRLLAWPNGFDLTKKPEVFDGFPKVFPITDRMLGGFIGDYRLGMEIFEQVKAIPGVTARMAAEMFCRLCEPMDGQQRLWGVFLGVEHCKFTFYFCEGYDYLAYDDKSVSWSDPMLADFTRIPKIPYKIERVEEREEFNLHYSMPGCDIKDDDIVDLDLKQIASIFIHEVAEKTGFHGHNADVCGYVLSRYGKCGNIKDEVIKNVAREIR